MLCCALRICASETHLEWVASGFCSVTSAEGEMQVTLWLGAADLDAGCCQRSLGRLWLSETRPQVASPCAWASPQYGCLRVVELDPHVSLAKGVYNDTATFYWC